MGGKVLDWLCLGQMSAPDQSDMATGTGFQDINMASKSSPLGSRGSSWGGGVPCELLRVLKICLLWAVDLSSSIVLFCCFYYQE